MAKEHARNYETTIRQLQEELSLKIDLLDQYENMKNSEVSIRQTFNNSMHGNSS